MSIVRKTPDTALYSIYVRTLMGWEQHPVDVLTPPGDRQQQVRRTSLSRFCPGMECLLRVPVINIYFMICLSVRSHDLIYVDYRPLTWHAVKPGLAGSRRKFK